MGIIKWQIIQIWWFFLKNIVGSQEAKYPQFLVQMTMTHYVLRTIFFRAQKVFLQNVPDLRVF